MIFSITYCDKSALGEDLLADQSQLFTAIYGAPDGHQLHPNRGNFEVWSYNAQGREFLSGWG